jgi:hypothetical protein
MACQLFVLMATMCFAVYNAMKAARHVAVTQHRPVLIEAMTYRCVKRHRIVPKSGLPRVSRNVAG